MFIFIVKQTGVSFLAKLKPGGYDLNVSSIFTIKIA